MIGEILGRYRIDAPLAAGGMGAVYRGYDLELQRSVAIKILTSVKDDQTARTRLLAEARAASSLNHPNICTVYEVGKPDGPAFIAMELVEGRSLNDLTPPDGLPVEAVRVDPTKGVQFSYGPQFQRPVQRGRTVA